MGEAKLEAHEVEKFGVRLTIFSNGDVYVSTPADIHIVQAKGLHYSESHPTVVRKIEKNELEG